MAAVAARRVGRLSHGLRLTSAVPIPLKDALQAVREAVQNDRTARGLGVEADTSWNAVVTLEHSAGPRTPPGLFYIWVPVVNHPLEQGSNLDTTMKFMENRINNRLELIELRESGIAVPGVREVRLWINNGARLLARTVEGEGWVEIPDSLRRTNAVANIQNTDRRCLI